MNRAIRGTTKRPRTRGYFNDIGSEFFKSAKAFLTVIFQAFRHNMYKQRSLFRTEFLKSEVFPWNEVWKDTVYIPKDFGIKSDIWICFGCKEFHNA